METNTTTDKSEAREGDFKGKPVLSLHRHSKDERPVRFGLVKAGLILRHIDDIRTFLTKHARTAAPRA